MNTNDTTNVPEPTATPTEKRPSILLILPFLILPIFFAIALFAPAYNAGKKSEYIKSFWLPAQSTIVTNDRAWVDYISKQNSKLSAQHIELSEYQRTLADNNHVVFVGVGRNYFDHYIYYATKQGELVLTSSYFINSGNPSSDLPWGVRTAGYKYLGGDKIVIRAERSWWQLGWVIIGGLIAGGAADIALIIITAFLLFIISEYIQPRVLRLRQKRVIQLKTTTD